MPSVSLPVPHYKQAGSYNCLPACAKMVLAYMGEQVSEQTLALQLETTPLGTPGGRLLRLSRYHRVDVEYIPLTLDLLHFHLRNNTPVIILVRTIFLDYWEKDTAHAVVVVGYDGETLLINDPAFVEAPQKATNNGLLAAWGEYDFYAGLLTKSSLK